MTALSCSYDATWQHAGGAFKLVIFLTAFACTAVVSTADVS